MSRRGSGRAGGRGKGKGRGTPAGAASAALVAATSGLSSGDWLDLNLAGAMVNTFGDVTYTTGEIDARDGLNAGLPNNVLEDWNGAAYDSFENRMLFWGGGHNAYGGNEVYELSLETLTWARITEAAPLTLYEPTYDNWLPEDIDEDGISDTPPTPHTYDSFKFLAGYGNAGGLMALDLTGVYMGTNPSTQDTNFILDLEDLTWYPYAGHSWFYATAVQTPYGMLASDDRAIHTHNLYLISDTGTETDLSTNLTGQTGREGVSVWHPTEGRVYTHRRDGMWALDWTGSTFTETFLAALPEGFDPYALEAQMGVVVGPDNRLYLNNGARPMGVFDPSDDTYSVIANTGSADAPEAGVPAGGGRVFSKIRYDPPSGTILMVIDQDEIWAYKI